MGVPNGTCTTDGLCQHNTRCSQPSLCRSRQAAFDRCPPCQNRQRQKGPAQRILAQYCATPQDATTEIRTRAGITVMQAQSRAGIKSGVSWYHSDAGSKPLVKACCTPALQFAVEPAHFAPETEPESPRPSDLKVFGPWLKIFSVLCFSRKARF